MRLEGVVSAENYCIRLLGLMGKKRWPKGVKGYYFPRCAALHTFFTFLRPDLLFLDKRHKILHVVRFSRPWMFYWGPFNTKHCLEVPGGLARKMGLKKDMHIQIEKFKKQ